MAFLFGPNSAFQYGSTSPYTNKAIHRFNTLSSDLDSSDDHCCVDGTILHYNSGSEDEDSDSDSDGDRAPPASTTATQAMTAGDATTATMAMVMFYMPAEREEGDLGV